MYFILISNSGFCTLLAQGSPFTSHYNSNNSIVPQLLSHIIIHFNFNVKEKLWFKVGSKVRVKVLRNDSFSG